MIKFENLESLLNSGWPTSQDDAAPSWPRTATQGASLHAQQVTLLMGSLLRLTPALLSPGLGTLICYLRDYLGPPGRSHDSYVRFLRLP